MSHHESLLLDALPDLPQSALLKQIAPRLWQQEGVVALWLGGSLASGQADQYSDLDIFVAVADEAMTRWLDPDFGVLFDGLCLAHLFSHFGDNLFVHHVLLASGDIYDVHVQSADSRLAPAKRLILGCREPGLWAALEQSTEEEYLEPLPVEPFIVQHLIETYWYDTHKHRKVLFRHLELLVVVGVQPLCLRLLRLYYILATGQDCGDLRRATIHSLTPVMQVLQERFGDDILKVVGLPTRTTAEIYAAIEALSGAIAQVGRLLAARYDFPYPEALETLVTRSWAEFKQRHPGSNSARSSGA